MPLPTMVQILEKSTMEPWYRTDESKQQIGKKEVQTLVYDTPNTTTIHVEKDKRRPALYMMFIRNCVQTGHTRRIYREQEAPLL